MRFLLLLFLIACAPTQSPKGTAKPGDKFVLSPELTSYQDPVKRAVSFLRLIEADKGLIKASGFDFTSHSPAEVVVQMKMSKAVQVGVYRPWWPWSRAVAYTDQTGINFNVYKLKREQCEVVNTLVHEWFHTIGYAHGDNYAAGKERTVPYYMGNMAQELCKSGKI